MTQAAASHAGADRNLLFGMLALQMDFIGRDALIEAMQAWVFQKDKSVGAILVQRGALTAERQTLLEALVQEHLQQHGNDAERSLAAIGPTGMVSEELQRIADPELRASLATVTGPSLLRQADQDTPAGSVGTPTSSGQRFRILRPHARGGLGEIFVAMDEELRREVALKQIQERHADHFENRARFLLEAEITGTLEHPGIVPIYGLGRDANGRPFYAMRFIRGESLKEAIARFHSGEAAGRDPGERAVELRQLLGRLVTVCQTVAYAHNRGVLHRDLKPSNIMLGQYGETLIVDWGLAKVMDGSAETASGEPALFTLSASDSGLTQAGSTLGTPAYSSPEQALARIAHRA